MDFTKLAYVDLETTGGHPGIDRITEVAIVRTEHGELVESWSSLVRPGVPIPKRIQKITGINDEMVADAPSLTEVLPDIERLLEGAALVAHNARFDAGFLRYAFAQAGMRMKCPVLCTVKLSRSLDPQHRRHNLDVLIERHGLQPVTRHRALGDASALPDLVASLIEQHGWEAVHRQFTLQIRHQSLPPHLDVTVLDRIPRGPGVYIFLGERDVPLYVGKSIDLRTRVMSHFSEAKRNTRELRMSQEIRDIRWIETAGELSALIRESELVKQLSPTFNRRLRRHKSLFSWHWKLGDQQALQLLDLTAHDARLGLHDQYGLFRNQKAAEKALLKAAEEHGLCLKVLGLERGKGPCFAYQLKRCQGACIGEEPRLQHDLRLAEALLPLRVRAWPYDNPIGVVEENPKAGIRQMMVIDQWRITAYVVADQPMAQRPDPNDYPLDLDIYKILVSYLNSGKAQIVDLGDAGTDCWVTP